MSNQILAKVNKKATNYFVSRKAIDRCASDGYIFESGKMSNTFDINELVFSLLKTRIVQALEIYYADQNNRMAFEKKRIQIDNVEIAMDNNEYAFSDYFSMPDYTAKRVIIKIVTYDIPQKHLRRISLHRNSFLDLVRYLQVAPIEPLSQLNPIFDEHLKLTDLERLMLINCDQTEFRIWHMSLDGIHSDLFEFEALIGRKEVQSILNRIKHNKSGKIQGISFIDPETKLLANCGSNAITDEHPVLWKWMYGDLVNRDCDSIFDINEEYACMLLRLNENDIEALQNIKTSDDALRYLSQ